MRCISSHGTLSSFSLPLCKLYSRNINRVHQSYFHQCFPAYIVFIATPFPTSIPMCSFVRKFMVIFLFFFSVIFHYFGSFNEQRATVCCLNSFLSFCRYCPCDSPLCPYCIYVYYYSCVDS